MVERSTDVGEHVVGDAELIAAVRGGDAEAFGALYERHSGAAWVVARQYSNTQADADDVVAEAFANVYEILQRGGGPDVAFRAYLFTAVRRLGLRRVEGVRRAAPSDDIALFERAAGSGPSADESTLEGFERDVVARAYESLPDRWRAVLWYTEVELLSPTQAGPILGLSPNGTSALAYRAREGLRQAYLQQHLRETSDTECRRVSALLGAYVRGGVSRREAEMVERHLDDCVECRALAAELADVNGGLRAVVGPLVLGAIGATALAQQLPIGGGLAAGAAAWATATDAAAAAAAEGAAADLGAAQGGSAATGTGASGTSAGSGAAAGGSVTTGLSVAGGSATAGAGAAALGSAAGPAAVGGIMGALGGLAGTITAAAAAVAVVAVGIAALVGLMGGPDEATDAPMVAQSESSTSDTTEPASPTGPSSEATPVDPSESPATDAPTPESSDVMGEGGSGSGGNPSGGTTTPAPVPDAIDPDPVPANPLPADPLPLDPVVEPPAPPVIPIPTPADVVLLGPFPSSLSLNVGTVATLTLNLRNEGESPVTPADGVTVRVQVPTGLSAAATAAGRWTCESRAAGGGSVLECLLPEAPGLEDVPLGIGLRLIPTDVLGGATISLSIGTQAPRLIPLDLQLPVLGLSSSPSLVIEGIVPLGLRMSVTNTGTTTATDAIVTFGRGGLLFLEDDDLIELEDMGCQAWNLIDEFLGVAARGAQCVLGDLPAGETRSLLLPTVLLDRAAGVNFTLSGGGLLAPVVYTGVSV